MLVDELRFDVRCRHPGFLDASRYPLPPPGLGPGRLRFTDFLPVLVEAARRCRVALVLALHWNWNRLLRSVLGLYRGNPGFPDYVDMRLDLESRVLRRLAPDAPGPD